MTSSDTKKRYETRIRVLMVEKGMAAQARPFTGGDLAKILRVSRTMINNTIIFVEVSPRIRAGIAQVLSVPYEFIWPPETTHPRPARRKKV